MAARGRGDLSGKVVPALRDLLRALHQYLFLTDDAVFLIVLGAVAAFQRGLDPVWLLIVAPPSGAKTDIVRMLDVVPGIYRLSDLTPHTLASGYIADDHRDASLLRELDNKILAVKDLTTLMQMRRDELAQVLGQLREIYDGQFTKTWGTGQKLDWSGRVGLVAGVTSVIDQHHKMIGILGQRFVFIRPEQPDRHAAACRAIANAQRPNQSARAHIATEVARFLRHLPPAVPSLHRKAAEQVAHVADVVTRARSPVIRHGYSRDIDDAPDPEMPGRLARQLTALARGIALVSGHRTVTKTDLRLVARVGADCLPPVRRTVLSVLTSARQPLLLDEVVHAVTANHAAHDRPVPADTSIRRSLEDLHALGVLERVGKGQGSPTFWSLTASLRPHATGLFAV